MSLLIESILFVSSNVLFLLQIIVFDIFFFHPIRSFPTGTFHNKLFSLVLLIGKSIGLTLLQVSVTYETALIASEENNDDKVFAMILTSLNE